MFLRQKCKTRFNCPFPKQLIHASSFTAAYGLKRAQWKRAFMGKGGPESIWAGVTRIGPRQALEVKRKKHTQQWRQNYLHFEFAYWRRPICLSRQQHSVVLIWNTRFLKNKYLGFFSNLKKDLKNRQHCIKPWRDFFW